MSNYKEDWKLDETVLPEDMNKIGQGLNIFEKNMKKTDDFFGNGGEVGGPITGLVGANSHRFMEHIGIFNSRNAKVRTGTGNINGYPAFSYLIEDLDNNDNDNGIVFLLGDGVSVDSRAQSVFRPYKNYDDNIKGATLGSPNIPWTDIFLKGFNKIGNSGRSKLPNSMMMQWGNIYPDTTTGTKDIKITYPIQFKELTSFNASSIGYSFRYSDILGYYSVSPELNMVVVHKLEQGHDTTIKWVAIGHV